MTTNTSSSDDDRLSLPVPDGVQTSVLAGPPPQMAAPAPVGPAQATAGHGQFIDAVWVDRANQIMVQDANDPFTLSKDYNKLKAEYMQARYGKTLKTNEELGA